ncbi:Modification methylase PaeR7I (Adenine-specific methyltransferase PaeR7I) (M.PaeR7I) [Candidatus Paraburkholderia schumanniana]|nr:Modification methylase PaeR7I (Adenine-specific methyltransferase PaeR7I) (M.PaeR7I) [Candidatus Paraburkholderia schumannianae]
MSKKNDRCPVTTAAQSGFSAFSSEVHAARQSAIDELHARTAIYTASPVVDDLLSRLGWPDGNRRLVNPSCGDGMFLARALDALLAARPAGFDPRGQIEGWEIHPAACVDARSRVAVVLASHGWSPSRSAVLANDMVHNWDFLTEGPTTPQWVSWRAIPHTCAPPMCLICYGPNTGSMCRRTTRGATCCTASSSDAAARCAQRAVSGW